jgi:hypothetical protein
VLDQQQEVAIDKVVDPALRQRALQLQGFRIRHASETDDREICTHRVWSGAPLGCRFRRETRMHA